MVQQALMSLTSELNSIKNFSKTLLGLKEPLLKHRRLNGTFEIDNVEIIEVHEISQAPKSMTIIALFSTSYIYRVYVVGRGI